MTKSVTTMIAVMALAAGLSAQHGKKKRLAMGHMEHGTRGRPRHSGGAGAETGRRHAHGHHLDADAAHRHDGRRRSQRRTSSDAAFTLSGSVEGAKDPTTIAIKGKLNEEGMLEGRVVMSGAQGPHGDMPVHGGASQKSAASETAVAAQRAERNGRHRSAPLPRGDVAGAPVCPAPPRPRRRRACVCVEMVHGSAGSSAIGVKKNLWALAAVGARLRPRADQPSMARAVPRHPHHRQQHRRGPGEPVHGEGNRRRSLPIELHVLHPGAPEADAGRRRPCCGVSLDQLYAQRFGQETAIPSMQLCIESVDAAGGCGNGYSCVYTDRDELGGARWAAADDP